MPRIPGWLAVLFAPVAWVARPILWLFRPAQPVMRTCHWCGDVKVCYSAVDPVCEECAPEYDDARAI